MPRNKVILIGGIVGSYRSQYIINYLAQRNYDFKFVYISGWNESTKKVTVSKIYGYLLTKFYTLIYLLWFPTATHVFMLPMNLKYNWVFKLAHKLGIKTIMDFYISRSYVSYENLKINEEGFSKKEINKYRRFDKETINYADDLLFLSKSEAEMYLNHLGIHENKAKINIFPLVSPLRTMAKLPGLRGTNDYFMLCWWGKASALHGIETILEAIKLLYTDKGDSFRFFLFEMDQERASMLETMIAEKDLQDVSTVRHDLSFSTGLEEFLVENCDIALGSFGSTKQAKTVLMNKVVDAISMGIPVVTRPTAAIKEFNLDNEIVFTVEPDAKRVCDKMLQLMGGGLDIDKYQQAAIDVHTQQFSEQRFYRDLDSLFKG